MEIVRRGLRWRGPIDLGLVEYLTGGFEQGWVAAGGGDPVTWALGVLGLSGLGAERPAVQTAFRHQLMQAHPDHGGSADGAAKRIADLTEARRILLAS